jgi:hypothetical protein
MKAARTKQQAPVHIEDMGVTDGLVDAITKIGQERAAVLVAMKEALLRGDDDEALEQARELTGLPSKRPTRRASASKTGAPDS